MTFAGIIRQGEAAPSPDRCICCGQQRRPMATTGVTIQGWGMVHICVGTTKIPGCLLQVAKDAGCVFPGDARMLEAKIEELEAQVLVLSTALHRRETVETSEPVKVVPVTEVEGWLAGKLGVPEAKRPREKAQTGGRAA